jgi:transcriptional regulator GlxA family with amidase domain
VAISEGSAIGASYHQSLAIAYQFDRGVQCATSWIIGHYNEATHVEELTALATMSVSSFHRHFRAVTSMTPIQFQKPTRLHEARAGLLAEPRDVAGVGFAVGLESPCGSAANTGAFGAPPGRDTLALREAAVLPSI